MMTDRILIWGIGCTLLSDQGFGVSVIQDLDAHYVFDDPVELVDGGLVGVGLVGLLAGANHLIAIDAVRNNGVPGDFYRWEDETIFQRFKAKNHVQQVEFLEALAHVQALDHPPHSVLLGIEPEDTNHLACELTPCLAGSKKKMMDCVLAELDRIGATYRSKKKALQSCA
jgi:hydrogenase maturation protease